MLYNCLSLNTLNLSNFDTSNVKGMDKMFYNCILITSLDLSNFNTSQVQKMNNMFYNCINLFFLNLSNFDISNVNETKHMFYNCSSLRTLYLSNYEISNINNLINMFDEIHNLEYINLSVLNLNGTIKDIFFLAYPNMVICGKNNDDISINSNLYSKVNVFCNNNKNYYNNINYICYMKELYLNNITCNICGKKFFMLENNSININNAYINCIDENLDNDFDIIQNDEDNRTEILQHIINNLINEFNITELDIGKDKKVIDKNKIIILTSTDNQKNNEEKDNYNHEFR